MSDEFQTILICGGTGSLGQALTRFLLATTDATIRILSRGELLQKQMAETFAHHADRMRWLLGDVRDLARLNLACAGADLVVHAAALKHIDKSETDPLEFIATNVNGTAHVISACRTMGVKRAVFISTDKAPHPANTYGATKMLAERCWIQANGYAPYGTEYVAVRYANVAASRGSVIPLWQSQIASGQPVTITDTRMTRFWLSLDDAVRLVWFAACHGPRGAVLVPHLPAFSVMDLLEALYDDDAQYRSLKHIGIRPGEKIHEQLATDEECGRMQWCSESMESTDGYYAIPPLVASWPTDARWQAWQAAGLVPPYSSDCWKDRLSAEQLREMVREME